ncbi:hypothetical protein B566_EDAN014719 [Ephemera danica]|nr:hypothetical protein B566_EDAN014719 [Ephemera danica]
MVLKRSLSGGEGNPDVGVTRSSPAHLQQPLTVKQQQRQRAAAALQRAGSALSSDEGAPSAVMDDILIMSHQHSQVGNLWVNYINSCFEQICKQRERPPLRVQCVGLDELGNAVSLAQEERMVRVKLQLVVICPMFLQPLGSYSQWKRMPVRDKDSTFVGEFLNEAMTIIARVAAELQAARQERAAFSVLPKKVKHGHNKVIVMLNEPLDKDDKVKITVNKNGEILEVPNVKRRNPFTLHFAMPDACLAVSMLVAVRVEKNSEALGSRQIKCESRMRELDQLLRTSDNPLDFMCQTLGYSLGDREQLDSFLVTAFQRNLPPHFSLFKPDPQDFASPVYSRKHSSPEEFPTLLHFAARFGLEKLAWQLLECPGGEQACEIRNGADQSAADQMNEFTSMYCYLKMAAEGKKPPKSPSIAGSDTAGEDYHLPRPINETYQVPPTPRLVRPPLPTPVEQPADYDSGGYLEMLPTAFANGGRSTSTNSLGRPLRNGVSNESYSLQMGKGSLRKTSRDKLPQIGVQDELVEIINDFKNNVFTISEVEKLDQLNSMREQYENIQEKMKEEMKSATPFDRIKNFFRGKSKETKESIPMNGIDDRVLNLTLNAPELALRPASSLSLHSICSTSSSERMSTMSALSGYSISDSGTHSDTEERKSQLLSLMVEPSPAFSSPAPGVQAYEVPPTPRPVNRARNNPTLNLSSPENNRPPMPVPRPGIDDEDSYYITFANNAAGSRLPSTVPEEAAEFSPDYLNFAPPPEVALPSYMNLTPKGAPPPVPPRVRAKNM